MTLGTNFECQIIDNKVDFTATLNAISKVTSTKENLQIFVSRTKYTNNQCLYKISFQLLPVGLDVLLPQDNA